MSDAKIPPLRPLDCTLFQAGKHRLVRLSDRLGISPDAAVPLPLFALIQLFDGERTVIEIQAEIARQTGQILPGTELERIVGELEKAYFLDSARFRERLREVEEEWRSSPVRPAAHAGPGGCYPDEAGPLDRHMEEIWRRGEVFPRRIPSGSLRAILAPHIDFARGGHVYVPAYREVRDRVGGGGDGEPGPLFVILGTCHAPMTDRFSVTPKAFGAPWGSIPADEAFIGRLSEMAGGQDLRADEFQHKNEHSIEFQSVFLRHALGRRPFTIAPILVGGFHEAVLQGVEPENDPAVARFLDALAGAIRAARDGDRREVVLVGGVDLAHVGRHFGDESGLTPEFLEEVRSRDRAFLAAAAAVDPSAAFEEISRDGDRRRVCGFSAIYAVLGVLRRLGPAGRLAGTVLAYDQAHDAGSDLCVSFASMVFDEGGPSSSSSSTPPCP